MQISRSPRRLNTQPLLPLILRKCRSRIWKSEMQEICIISNFKLFLTLMLTKPLGLQAFLWKNNSQKEQIHITQPLQEINRSNTFWLGENFRVDEVQKKCSTGKMDTCQSTPDTWVFVCPDFYSGFPLLPWLSIS